MKKQERMQKKEYEEKEKKNEEEKVNNKRRKRRIVRGEENRREEEGKERAKMNETIQKFKDSKACILDNAEDKLQDGQFMTRKRRRWDTIKAK